MPKPPLFSSVREGRLWLWTLLVVTAIYSTLGPARTIASGLRERNLLAVTIVTVLILIVLTIASSWIKKRPDWREAGVVLAVVFAYFMVGVRIESWEERTHLIEYGIVAALIHEALIERIRNGRVLPYSSALMAVLATAVLGFIDEGIQYYLPSRVFDFRDVFFNTFAGFMVIAARLAIGPQKGPGWRLWFLWLMAEGYAWGTAVEVTRLGELSLQSNPERWTDAALGVAFAGTLVSVLQWLILRRYLTWSWRWILAGLGAGAMFIVLVFGIRSFYPESAWVSAIVSIGFVAGVLQWLVLKGEIPKAHWWILVCTVGWLLAIPAGEEVGWNGVGAVHGAISGIAMVVLLRQKKTSSGL